MTPQPPSPPPGPPDLETLLRDRLHEVDELVPPDTGFEQRALRAGRERVHRRRSWTRGLVGVAAAVMIGALVVPAVARHEISSGGSASSAGVAEAPASSDVGQDNGQPGPGLQAPENQTGAGSTAVSTIPATGSLDYNWNAPSAAAALAQLRSKLSGAAFSPFYTSLTIDDSTFPRALVVHLTQFDLPTMNIVAQAFPPGTPISFAKSAYSAASCAATLDRIVTDRTELAQAGYLIGSTACASDGRVQLQLNSADPTRLAGLRARYGDPVVVTASVGVP